MRHFKSLSILVVVVLAAGCATAPNVHFASGITTRSTVNPDDPNEIRLVSRAGGVSFWTTEMMENGFMVAARHFCGGREFVHEKRTGTYSYTSAGAFGMTNQHIGIETVGTVRCKAAAGTSERK